MAWIEVHQALLTHRKTLRLARLLHMDTFAVVGRLMALWCWALDNAPDGVIAAQDSDLLADVMGWDGTPSELITALTVAGYLDARGDGYAIHDWQDYAGKLSDRRERNKLAMRAARAATKGETTDNLTVLDTCTPRDDTCKATVPNRTQQNRTEPERENAREVAATAHHNEPLSLSLVASHGPEAETRAEPETPAPIEAIPDPLAERDRNHALYDAWCAATGYTPKTSGERKSWLKALAGMRQEVGLSPPGCAPLVQQYRAKMGNDKQPTPGQVSAMYSQLGVSPHVVSQLYAVGQHHAQHPAPAPESPDDLARRVRASRVAAGLRVPPKPELDNLGTP